MTTKFYLYNDECVKIPTELISQTTFHPRLVVLVQKILKFLPRIFQISRCSFYRIFPVADEIWCEITAGIPATKEHGIGSSWLIKNKLDILRAINSMETKVKDNLLNDTDTEYFRDWIIAKGINAILYSPISEGDLRGLIVVDATGEKKNFSEEEKLEFKDTFLDLLHELRETTHQELRDRTINQLINIGARVKRIIKNSSSLPDNNPAFKKIKHEAEMLQKEESDIELELA